MTREEAIRWLEDIHRRFNPTRENLENEGGDVHLQALDMAIKALKCADGDRISRQDAIKTVIRMCAPICDWELEKKAYTDCVIDEINSLTSAEAVQVVRCKDCKWYGHIGCAIEIKDDSDRPKPDDFCSFGEKRGDADEQQTNGI